MNHKQKFILFTSIFTLIISTSSFAQISGTVKDVNGESLVGVSVLESGTTKGVITDADGNFTINVPQGKMLKFSSIGYNDIEKPAEQNMNVMMSENAELIDDVVVIGYGSTRKDDLSMAVSTVKVDQSIKSRPSSMSSIMQGRISGVTVASNGGDPLSNNNILIRGRGSRNGDGVLYVVDGVPGGIFNIEDVESITVLKDAASAAIYGATVGSGGVIVVTTKQAVTGKMKIDVNLSRGFKSAWRLPKTLTAEQYNQVMTDAYTMNNLPIPSHVNPEIYPYGQTTRTNWVNEIFRMAPSDHLAFAISGGNDFLKGSASVSYDNDQGILLNTFAGKFGSKLGLEFQVNKWIKLSEKVTFQYTNGQGNINSTSHEGVLINAIFYPRSATVYEYDRNGNPVLDPATGQHLYGGTVPLFASGTVNWPGEIRNPVATLNRLTQQRPNIALYSTTSLNIRPISKLVINSDFTYSLNTGREEVFSHRIPEIGLTSKENSLNIYTNWNPKWIWETIATYSDIFNEKHHFSAMVGYTMGYETFSDNKTYTYDYVNEDKYSQIWTNATNWSKTKPEANRWEESLISIFGRASYSYDDRYFVTASLRRDATSKLYSSNNYGYFPAFSGSWKISSEEFFSPVKSVVNLFKLRASWGQIGNVNLVPRYSYNVVLSVSPWDTFLGINGDNPVRGIYQSTVSNKNLKWETTEQTGAGADIALWNNTITLSIDWFNKLTKDLIEQIPMASTAGVAVEPYGNVGKVLNRGWEFGLGFNKNVGEVQLNANANLSTIYNEVLDIGQREYFQHDNSVNSIKPLRSQVGQPWYSYHLIQTDGIFQSDQEVDSYTWINADGTTNKIQPNAKAGDLKYVDYNNDGKINDDDKQFLGSYLPKLTYAFGAGLSWKGIDFNFFFQGVSGVKIYNGFKQMGLNGRGQGNNMLADVLNSWNYNQGSNIPRLSLVNDPNGNYNGLSDFYLEDGSYLRLKSVIIGYTFPKFIMSKIGLSNSILRLYASGENLLTFTKYTGFDPEVGNLGLDGGRYPVARSFTIGLNFNF